MDPLDKALDKPTDWLGFRDGIVVARYNYQGTADLALMAREVDSVGPLQGRRLEEARLRESERIASLEAVALEAERRIESATTWQERDYWTREAAARWDRVPSRIDLLKTFDERGTE